MRKMLSALATIILLSQFSLAIGADPNLRRVPSRPMPHQREGTIPQLQLTHQYFYQHITALQQQVAGLQTQVNALQSVVKLAKTGRRSKQAN